jgi:N-acetylglutamate synthase
VSTLGDRDVGHRVVVRRRLPDARLTDVLGVLQTADPSALVVRRANGSIEVIPHHDVTAAKTVPRLPLRALDRAELPLIAALGRPAAETARIGEWMLRASKGWTGRANSLLPHGDPGIDVSAALARVVEFYTERELPPLAQVVLGSGAERELRSRGWIEARPDESDTLALHTTLDTANAEPAWPVTVTETPGEEWYAAAFANSPPPDVARVILEGAPRCAFAAIRLDGPADGRVVAVGRAAVTGHWLGIDRIRVDEQCRRRGLGTAIVQGLARWGGVQGCRRTYIEVVSGNTPALAAYERLGYAEAYRYRYLTVPS